MADLAAQSRELIRDEQFQALPPERRLATFRAFASKADPEGFAKLDEQGQTRTAAQIINEHQPGFLDTVKDVAMFPVRHFPVIGTEQAAARAAADPAQERPLTRRLLQAIGAGETGLSVGAGVGRRTFTQPGTPTAQDVGQQFERAVSATAAGRFTAEATRDIAELMGGFKLASAAVKGVVSRFGLEKSGEMMARALGAGTADEAVALASQATRRKLVEKVTERIATDVTVGEMFGVATAIERGEAKPLEDFVANPLMIAALGLGLMGAGAAVKRFGPVRIQEATAALEGQGPAGADLKGVSRDAQRVADAVRRSSQLDKEAAGEVVFKVATGKADASETRLVRDLMIQDPSLVKNEFGLHLTRMLRPELSTKVEVADGPLRVRYEDPKTRKEVTVSLTKMDEVRALAKQAELGEIHVIEAKGRAQEIALFEPEPAVRPSVASGSESLPVREPETFEPPPTMFPGGRSGQLEPAMRLGDEPLERMPSIIDALEREQMKSPFEAAPQVAEKPLIFAPESYAKEPVAGTFGPGAARREGNVPLRSAYELAMEKIGTPTPRPESQTLVPVRGSTDQAAVVSSTDPRGVQSRLPNGDVVISKYGSEGVEAPNWMTAPPAEPATTQLELQLQKAAGEVVGERPMTLIDASGQAHRTIPDPQLNTVTVVDPVTRQAEVVSTDVAKRVIAEGGLKVDADLTKMSLEQLLTRADELSVPGVARSLDDLAARISEHSKVVGELLNRRLIASEAEITERGIGQRLLKPFTSEQGAVLIGPGGRNVGANLLKRNDPVSIQARMLGGRAREIEGGQITVDFTFGKQRLSVSYADKAAADAGLRSIVTARLEQARITEGGLRAVDRHRLAAPGEAVDPDTMAPQLRAAASYEYAPLGSVDRYATGRPSGAFDAVLPAISRLNRLGPAGQEFAQRAQAMRELSDRLRGQAMMELERSLDGLSKEEIATAVTAYEKGTASPQMAAVMDRLSAYGKRQLDMARQIGLEAAEEIEGRYAPHVFDIAQLRDKRVTSALIQETIDKGLARNAEEALMVLDRQGIGTSRDQIVRNMVDRASSKGVTMTRAEAESVLERFISQNAERISGHLERERLGVQGYVDDARRAYAVYFTRNARRLAEAQVFGPRDEHILKLIDEIEAGPGGYAGAQYARQVYDHLVGRTREEMTGFWRGLYNWQTAKLSLSVFANSSQSLNTATRTGLVNTARALFEVGAEAAAHPKAFAVGRAPSAQHAREIGAVTMDILGDIRSRGMLDFQDAAASLPARVARGVKGGVEDVSLAMFNLVEVGVNRSVAVRAGERYFMQNVERAIAGDARAMRRLNELGFKSDAVKGADRDTLTEMMYLAGQRLSNQTQFKADALHTPLWAQSNLGRFLFQFKSFSVNQAKFMWNEIAGSHGDLSRRLRALGILTTAYPAVGIGLTKLRSALMGPTIASETIDAALDDPSVSNLLMAGVAGLATSGALGIVSDIALTQTIGGNKFNLMAALISPMASTGINVFEAGRSVVQGLVSGDSLKYQAAVRNIAREFGGVGATAAQAAFGEPPAGGGSAPRSFGAGGGFSSSGFGSRSFGR